MPGYQITDALVSGSALNYNLPVGKHNGKLFVIAFNQLRSDEGAGSGENWIRGFRSTDDGVTWTQVGTSLRVFDQAFDCCVDGRGDASPYMYVTFLDIHINHVVARFNMETETFDLENHFLVNGAFISRSYVASDASGDIRFATAEGNVTLEVDNTFTHEFTPYTLAVNPATLGTGGPQAVPGIVPGIGAYAFMGIAPAPAAGGHPEGARGWAYILAEQYYDGANFPSRTVFFDDTGARIQFLDGTDGRCRTGVRQRGGAPEPFILTYQTGTTNYWSELVSNDGGVSAQCSQGQVPTVTIQGNAFLTGGGTVVGRGEDGYLLWFQGHSLKASKAAGSLASCGGWGAFETLLTVDESPIFVEGASSISDGIAVLYAANDVSPSEVDQWFDVWYCLYPLGGGCPQPEVSTHECSDVPDQDTETHCGSDSDQQGYAV